MRESSLAHEARTRLHIEGLRVHHSDVYQRISYKITHLEPTNSYRLDYRWPRMSSTYPPPSPCCQHDFHAIDGDLCLQRQLLPSLTVRDGRFRRFRPVESCNEGEECNESTQQYAKKNSCDEGSLPEEYPAHCEEEYNHTRSYKVRVQFNVK